MHYEPILFTRNQRQDFTAFIRPKRMSNKDVSAIGGIFNYVTDISRLTADFPSLYYFPLGEYVLLLRHYDSGRKHAGRAIGVIEGVALPQTGDIDLGGALAHFVDQQAALLDVTATVGDIEEQQTESSTEQVWDGQAMRTVGDTFVGEFLARRKADRLFVPFTSDGRDMLTTALSDARFAPPPFFAFGTNSDVLAQLERQAPIDIVSFFRTERPSYRSRRTNGVTGSVVGYAVETAVDSSMSLRPIRLDETRLRPEPTLEEDDQTDIETMVGADAMSIRSFQKREWSSPPDEAEDDDVPTLLTMRQMRDQLRAEEAAVSEAQPDEAQQKLDPIHWLLKLVSSLISPGKPK